QARHGREYRRFCAVLAGKHAWLELEFLLCCFAFLQRDASCQMFVTIRKNLDRYISRGESGDRFAIVIGRSLVSVLHSDHAILGFTDDWQGPSQFRRRGCRGRWWSGRHREQRNKFLAGAKLFENIDIGSSRLELDPGL